MQREIEETAASEVMDSQANLLTASSTVNSFGCEDSDLEGTSDTHLVPLPPTPYFKIIDKFLFDEVDTCGELPAEPKDWYNLHFIAFMVLGAGFHLPFNSFVAAVDYFMLTCNRSNMTFLVASTNSYTVCVAVVINVMLVNRVSTNIRISFGYLAFMISLVSMALLVGMTIFGVVNAELGFMITIGATIFTGIGCGVQEASFYGYAGMLPSKYTRAIMLGESFAGLVVSLNRIVTKLTIEDPLTNTVIFFSLSIVCEIVCIVLYRYIRSCKFIQYYKLESKSLQRSVVSVSPLPLKEKATVWESISQGITTRLTISRKIWKLMFGILNVYFVTNLLYPGFTSIISSSWPHGWFPVVLITAFNLSDMIGTMATGLPWKMSDKVLLIVGAVRWVLIPLLLLSVLPLSEPIISGEYSPLIIILIIGFTTGYMGSTPMCAAAENVSQSERELAGNIMTMMMLLGLTTGSTAALLVNQAIGIGGPTEF